MGEIFTLNFVYSHDKGSDGGIHVHWPENVAYYIGGNARLYDLYGSYNYVECDHMNSGSTCSIKLVAYKDFTIYYRAWDWSKDAVCENNPDIKIDHDRDIGTCTENCNPEKFPDKVIDCNAYDAMITVMSETTTTSPEEINVTTTTEETTVTTIPPIELLSCTGTSEHSCSEYYDISSIDSFSAPESANCGENLIVTVEWTGWHGCNENCEPNYWAFFIGTKDGQYLKVGNCNTFNPDDCISNDCYEESPHHYVMDCEITMPDVGTIADDSYNLWVTSETYEGYCLPNELVYSSYYDKYVLGPDYQLNRDIILNNCGELTTSTTIITPPADYCGDGYCSQYESCSSCPEDCGTCPPPADYCGDGYCSQYESCSSCPEDCGTCPPPAECCCCDWNSGCVPGYCEVDPCPCDQYKYVPCDMVFCQETTTTIPTNTPPRVLPGYVKYTGNKYSDGSITFWCNVTDSDQDASTLDVRLWVETCDPLDCSNTIDFNDPAGLRNLKMTWNSNSRMFKYDWTIPWTAGTTVAGTCNATDNQGAGSNQGNKYPFFTVLAPGGKNVPIPLNILNSITLLFKIIFGILRG
jgi:hypothetical protein